MLRELIQFWPKNTMKRVSKQWNAWFWKFSAPTAVLFPRSFHTSSICGGFSVSQFEAFIREWPSTTFALATKICVPEWSDVLLHHFEKKSSEALIFPNCEELHLCFSNCTRIPKLAVDTFPRLKKVSGCVWLRDLHHFRSQVESLNTLDIDASDLRVRLNQPKWLDENLPGWRLPWNGVTVVCACEYLSEFIAKCDENPDWRGLLRVEFSYFSEIPKSLRLIFRAFEVPGITKLLVRLVYRSSYYCNEILLSLQRWHAERPSGSPPPTKPLIFEVTDDPAHFQPIVELAAQMGLNFSVKMSDNDKI